jgi:hypothetical protein
MDYLKYIGVSLASIAALGFAIKMVGVNLGTLGVLGAVIGYFIMYRPAVWSVGYLSWIVLLFGATALLRGGLQEAAIQNPEKYSPAKIHFVVGFWLVAGGIILHPISYWFGRLSVPLGRKILKLSSPVSDRRGGL